MFAYNGRNHVATLLENLEKYRQYWAEGNDESSRSIIQDALDAHTSVVEVLLKANANQDLVDKEGRRAVDFDFKPGKEEADSKEKISSSEHEEL